MKKWLFVLLILSGVGVWQHQKVLTTYASFFTVNNPSKGADAIIVLSGSAATRIPRGLELYGSGYASKVFLTDEKRSMNPKFRKFFPTNAQLAKAIIAELGMEVETPVIPSLKGGATSTFDEAYDARTRAESEGWQHLILVTDAFHTRRALHAFESVFNGSGIRLEMAAAPNAIFREDNWWTSDQGISAYVLESIKYPVYLLTSRNVSFVRND
jgi:uncharacterized SAM-binding protein YcdF (DUF218 family)